MPGNPLTDPNWAKEVTDTIDRYVGKVRTTVTDRAVYAVRAVVFGIVIAIGTDHDSSIWISYVVLGGLLVLAGSWMMRKRFEGDAA